MLNMQTTTTTLFI